MNATQAFEQILAEQLERIERMKAGTKPLDFGSLRPIIIGTIGGDGIGPVIVDACRHIIEKLLAKELANGSIELREIPGLTIENRVEKMETLPHDVLAAIKECHVFLKGPTTTPGEGDGLPNLESANVALRKELDLFANMRPVSIRSKNIDWTFFRENTEGEYALGSQGVDVNDDLSMDFKVTTTIGTTRLARTAFEYARANGKKRVSIITKANIMKRTDGKFLRLCYNVAKEYPEIQTDDWYVDIMAAKLISDQSSDFNVFILPNLYGDILTDEAAQIQGGVGTAGSANIGGHYAMFEAIHGSAPRMIQEGRGGFSNPASICRAAVMMLRHIKYMGKADQLEAALNQAQSALNLRRDGTGDSTSDFTKYVTSKLKEDDHGII